VGIEDSFDWEQSMIRSILDWILDQRLSLGEAFKLMDTDFDGVLTLRDLSAFLRDTFNVNLTTYRVKLERLFRILDLSKSGRLFQVDFENLFTRAYHLKTRVRPSTTTSAAHVIVDWKDSCLE